MSQIIFVNYKLYCESSEQFNIVLEDPHRYYVPSCGTYTDCDNLVVS